MSVVEQRYRALTAVLDGAKVSEVAAEAGVSRQSLHAWLGRYRRDGLAGLADRTHRPRSCPHQASAELEALVCELRREHPKWGALRILPGSLSRKEKPSNMHEGSGRREVA